MKKIVSAVVISLIVVGCGSDSSGSSIDDLIASKDFIMIANGVPSGECSDPDTQNYFISELEGTGAYGFVFQEQSSTVTCATYGRESEINSATEEACQTISFNEGSATCVIAFDISSTQSKSSVINETKVLMKNF